MLVNGVRHSSDPYMRLYNTKYWEQLQKHMDAAKTRAASVQLRKNWIDASNRNNYVNEYHKILGDLSRLPQKLQREQIIKMMGKDKVDAIENLDLGVAGDHPLMKKPALAANTTEAQRIRRLNRTPEEKEALAKQIQASRAAKIAFREENRKKAREQAEANRESKRAERASAKQEASSSSAAAASGRGRGRG